MKRFCVMPWFSRELETSDDDNFCCWVEGKQDRTKTQQQFLNDVEPTECRRCWGAETRGTQSRREMQNVFLDQALDLSIENIEQLVRDNKDEILLYQVILTNTCNSTCITCRSEFSSAWAALERKAGITPFPVYEASIAKLSNAINFKTAKAINLLGGEAFLSEHTWWILDQLIANDNTDCLVSIVTNGSILLDKHIAKLEACTNLDICLSIDGIGKAFEYLRYPLKWDIMLANLDKFRKLARYLTISYTESNLNVDRTPETIAWFEEQGLSYIVNRVQTPAYFAPDVQPGHKLWPEFEKQIALQDKLKGTSFNQYWRANH